MALEYRTPDWDKYRMDYGAPFKTLEPEAQELAAAGELLDPLVAGVHHVHQAARVDGHARGDPQLPGAAAGPAASSAR
jgi:hypothetical protein